MVKVRAVVTMHTNGPNYQCARYEHGSIPPKGALLECTWYLVSLVDAIACACTTFSLAACDVLTDIETT